MTYSVTIGGEPLSEKVKGAHVSSWEYEPGEVVKRYVDVPGVDGGIDCSEMLTGFPEYGMAKAVLAVTVDTGGGKAESSRALTELKRWLHGRAYDFVLSWDCEYTYHGRFFARSETPYSGAAVIVFEIACNPWKTKGERTYRVEASGGKTVLLRLGAPVVPTVTCDVPCLVNYMGETHAFGPGTSRDPGLVLRGPEAYLTVNATPDAGTAAWSAYDGLAWADFGPARVSLLATAGKPEEAAKDWLQPPFAGTWSDIDGTWAENSYATLDDPPKRNVYITYEWKDL